MNYDHSVVKIQKKGNLEYLTFPCLEKYSWLGHLFSTRCGGVSEGDLATMNLSFSRGDRPENVKENFRRIAETLDRKVGDFVFSDQTHTSNVMEATKQHCGMGILRGRTYHDIDALITDCEEIVLCCFYADCVPIYLVDPIHHAIGLCHSGWKGTVLTISACTIDKMEQRYATKAEDLITVIGPSICRDCYEITSDVAEHFKKLPYQNTILEKTDETHYHLDLWEANRQILLNRGLKPENIHVSKLCTCCNHEFLFSHRATKGKRGNLGAFLTLNVK